MLVSAETDSTQHRRRVFFDDDPGEFIDSWQLLVGDPHCPEFPVLVLGVGVPFRSEEPFTFHVLV
ncbi:hypothetical protein CH259_16475 [Rhodococcus sp. 05-2254-4]|nr:hypothetical protein CH259_16475 [Rhodococcus sp. 05-2254-4]OZE48050.1 hypothetical protein CH261_09070 [Rhodococcus sp. 05-2254-3]OZE49261.1 hypothetical protein CH283_16855 [Rhodococcus sp. 05-2254-2]